MFLRFGQDSISVTVLLAAFLKIATAATEVNRTIDDTLGDSVTGDRPTYLPLTVWGNATCDSCSMQPDVNQAFEGTWTSATYDPQLGSEMMVINLSFTGSAIYIFFILPNATVSGITSPTECNFTLDSQAAGSFIHVPDLNTDIQYNALVFSHSNLSNVDHNLTISTAGVDHQVFVNFDYAIYTTIDDIANTTTSSNRDISTSVTAITGVIVGAVVGLLALLFLLLFWRRRRRGVVSVDAKASSVLPFDDTSVPLIHSAPFPTPYRVDRSDSLVKSFTTAGPYTSHSSDTGSRLSLISSHSTYFNPTQTIISTLPSGEVLMTSGSDTTLMGTPPILVRPTSTYHKDIIEATRQQRQVDVISGPSRK